MQLIAANAEKMSADSLQKMIPDNNYNTVDSSIIGQSIQRDDETEQGGAAIATPFQSLKPTIPIPVKPTEVKAVVVKPVVKKEKEIVVKKTEAKKPVIKQKAKPSAIKKPEVTQKINNDY
jgi:hypothetical protein